MRTRLLPAAAPCRCQPQLRAPLPARCCSCARSCASVHAGRARRAPGKRKDRYDATYKVRYLLEDKGEGYKISRAAVLANTDHA
jgi:hypothetical protein